MNNNNIKNSKSIRVAAALSFAAVAALGTAYGGVPLNNLQGAGGIAFNPLAYTAGQPWEGGESNSLNNVVSKPQFGAWYVNLNDADINWGAFGAAFTVANRLELSAGYELVRQVDQQVQPRREAPPSRRERVRYLVGAGDSRRRNLQVH